MSSANSSGRDTPARRPDTRRQKRGNRGRGFQTPRPDSSSPASPIYQPRHHPRTVGRGRTHLSKTTDVARTRLNDRIAVRITKIVGTMACVYVLCLVMFVWIGAHALGVAHFDPYPFLLLLFIGNIFQLLMMPLIMVGQSILGRASDERGLQTYLDAEAVLHEARELQNHLCEQDRVIHALERALSDKDALVDAVSQRIVERASAAAEQQQQHNSEPITTTGFSGPEIVSLGR